MAIEMRQTFGGLHGCAASSVKWYIGGLDCKPRGNERWESVCMSVCKTERGGRGEKEAEREKSMEWKHMRC